MVLDMPLQRRTVVAYNAQSPDSVDVAQYYVGARYIPAANLCPITNLNFSSSNFATYNGVNISVFHNVRNQLRACVDAIGRKQILYIAFSTDMPISVDFSPMAGQPTVVVPYPVDFGAIGLDSAISDLWTDTPYPVGYSGAKPRIPNRYAYRESPPFVGLAPYIGSFATFRAKNSHVTEYSVSRFGPTKALALAQINDSLAAENQNGPSGVACFDKITGGSVVQYIDPVIDLAAARAVQAGYSTVIDTRSATFGQDSSEGPTTQCLGGAFYFGAYNYGVYRQSGYSWSPGSFGWDINSDRMWGSSAVAQGLSATVFPLWEPYVDGFGHFPATLDSLFRGLNWGDSSHRGVTYIWWQMAVVGDPLYRPYRLTRP